MSSEEGQVEPAPKKPEPSTPAPSAPVSSSTIPSHVPAPTPAAPGLAGPPPERSAVSPEPALPASAAGHGPTFGTGAPVPLTQLDKLGRPKVDKYFGSKLPPVCRQLGCYVTDDAKYFYCINPHCHKDRKRETKYNRRRKSIVYFFCPKCKSREIQLHLRKNNYECLECAYTWKN